MRINSSCLPSEELPRSGILFASHASLYCIALPCQEPCRSGCPPQDVAIYGALCGMAALSRAELSGRLLNNVAFRELLELVPEVTAMPSC